MAPRQIESDIFLVPLGDRPELRNMLNPKGELYMVYAPLARKLFFVDDEDLPRVDDGVLSQLRVTGDISRFFSRIHHVNDLQKLAVLPNHTCNFSCSYCYSAKGRSSTVLERGKLEHALDFFFDPNRLAERNLTISFIGGGEPLLSWPLVKWAMEHSRRLADERGFNLLMTLVTNGSVMNDDIISTLLRYQVLPDVSFDILEEAQNKNRRNFDIVCDTIDRLCDNGLAPSVNATITPDTVVRMEEMVEFMEHRFPLVSNMVFEPVVSDVLFPEASDLKAFYDRYLDGFFKARRLASKRGKLVTCRIYKNVDSLVERGCPSKFALTPQGDISICYCTSSPKEKMYAKRVYGKVTDDGVVIDSKRFDAIHQINVHSFPKCSDCFAKWHCGGGCMCPNDLYDESHLDAVCIFTKEMVVRTLLERVIPQIKK